MTPFRRLALAPACASLLVLAACGSDDDADADDPPAADTVGSDEPAQGAATATSGPGAATEATVVDQTVPEVLQFSAPAVGGGEIDAAALAGTPTVFWFWAPT